MSLCPYNEELVTLLSNTKFYDTFKFVIIPQVSENGNRFELFQEDNQVEIVCYKSTFLSLFKECHIFLKKFVPDMQFKTYLDTNVNPFSFYQITIGLLLTTTENKTNINMHSDVFFALLNKLKSHNERIDFLSKETFIITRLLTCSSNKVNKSSSLYIWYRKLFILWQGYVSEHTDNKIDKLLLTSKLFIDSGKQHFANYYSWNTSRWIFDNMESLKSKELFINAIKSFCFQNLSDCSSWDTLSYMICQYKVRNVYHIKDFDRLKGILVGRASERKVVWLQMDLSKLVQNICNHICRCNIKTWPPFLCLLRIFSVYSNELTDKISQIKNEWLEDINVFESKFGKIELYNGFTPVINSGEHDNDYLRNESILHLGQKLVFLNKLSGKSSVV